MFAITEIFGVTIQGEGKRIGTPSIFVRFGKCNMNCSGYNIEYETPCGTKRFGCDSYYASDSAFSSFWKNYSTALSIIKEIDKLLPKYKVDIVITGGEPLLYWQDDEFQKLLKHYIDSGYHITIETNASIDITLNNTWHADILFSMSVKLSNSGEKESKRINYNTINEILDKTTQSYLKFVVGGTSLKQASDEIDIIIKKINPCEIYLMPMGDTICHIDNNSLGVIELAIKKGYKYSDRLHIRVWNNKRGV